MSFASRFESYQNRVEQWLHDYVDELWPYEKLADAMAYSLLSGGKRIRPILTLEACRFSGGEPETALPFACAVEMIHTYSLIHDDLPCMDDDDFRRGKPSNHKIFGQATAVLAGDALLTSAFEVLSKAPKLTEGQRLRAVACLSAAAGPNGMVAGQILDMAAPLHTLSAAQVQAIERLKTGSMIVASARLGCIAAHAEEAREAALCLYAEKIGLAFQIQDDILDVQGSEAELGKPIGSDAENEKTTFVTLHGLAACGEMVARLTEEAIAAVQGYPESAFLCELAQLLAGRKK